MLSAGFTLMLALLLAAPPAQATPTPNDTAIPPLVWELVELTGEDGSPIEIAEPASYTVQFLPDNTLAVRADCNQAAGTYTAGDGALELGLIASTLALCPPDSQAESFRSLLEQATTYAFDRDGFLLLGGDNGSLRLRASLVGVVWEWQEFAGGNDEIIRTENPADYTLTFLDDDKLAIQADCNRAMGTYEAEGPTLDLRVGGVTRVMCPPGSLMAGFLRDLGEVSSHVFREGHLYLALPVDAGILEFAAKPIAPPGATPEAG
jgi:heat shock protein HslJ